MVGRDGGRPLSSLARRLFGNRVALRVFCSILFPDAVVHGFFFPFCSKLRYHFAHIKDVMKNFIETWRSHLDGFLLDISRCESHI